MMIPRDQLKILLEAVAEEIPKIVTHFKIKTRIEHDNLSARLYFSLRRNKEPDKETVKINIEFLSVFTPQRTVGLHLDAHTYLLTKDLSDPELKDVIILHAMCSIVPYQLANRPT
ncbi:MAG: hypothetical protein HZA36_00070 [Parcubacteria group bacterium]|nr:hypothetical protein [Parcubacteria group bacterium]